MKKSFFVLMSLIVVMSLVLAPLAEAKGRKGSTRVGGTSTGKGSHYVGGRK
jgi:uncharacterized membrane protein